MCHIVEFAISGLAGRKHVYAQNLNKDSNIFFGLNGSGKTSLLKVLHSALSGDTEILRNVPFKQAEVKLFSPRENINFTCKIAQAPRRRQERFYDFPEILFSSDLSEEARRELLSLHGGNRQAEVAWEVTPETCKSKNEGGRGVRHAYLPVSRPYLTKRLERLPFSEEQLDLLFAKKLQDLWVRYSAEMLRNIQRVQEDGLASILKTILAEKKADDVAITVIDKSAEVEVHAAYEKMQTFLRRQKSAAEILGSREHFMQRYAEDPRLQQVVRDIHAIEKEIELTVLPRQNLQRLIQNLFSHKQIEFSDDGILVKTEEGESLGLHLLSSGERQLVLILLETFLAGASVVLIDEPEMSMHIDWQLALVTVMRQLNPEAQLILATHSPEIMAEVADDKIFRLDDE